MIGIGLEELLADLNFIFSHVAFVVVVVLFVLC